MASVGHHIVRLGRGLAWLLRKVVGEFEWRAPGWARSLRERAAAGTNKSGSWVRANPGPAAAIGIGTLVLVAALHAGYNWYQHRPKPVEITLEVTQPERTHLEDPNAKPFPVVVKFSGSTAPLALVGKAVPGGIDVQPTIDGVWQWTDDQTLSFQPKNDWPVDGHYHVVLARQGFAAEHVLLDRYKFDFNSAPFTASIAEAQFNQDPIDPAKKKIVATVRFSHPVDTADFEKRILLREQGKSAGVLGFGAENTKFQVSYDKLKLAAFIHSDPLPIPPKDLGVNLTIGSGVRSALGGNATGQELVRAIEVPGLYSLRVNDLALTQADNERMEPDRILVLTYTAMVHERAAAKAVHAWVLPVYRPNSNQDERKHPYQWADPSKIGPEILHDSEALTLDPIAAERENVETHSFKLHGAVDAGRYIYVEIEKGTTSFGGYVQKDTFDTIVRAEAFPKQLKIMAEGSLLALSGEKKLPVMARDIDSLRFDIGRVLPQQLQHLVTQSGGTFAHPEFNSGFDDSNLTERFTQIEDAPVQPKGRPYYQALDLGRYLDADGANRRGIFYVRVQSYDKKNKRVTGVSDSRLIVVTDLGIVLKRSVDGSQDVFVQSIHSGLPVAGTTVEVIGKNGLPLLSETTDASGRAHFPDLKSFEREKAPVLYLARKAGDSSFLPMNRNDRMLDFSRFDIGGVASSTEAGKLTAYMFSDRGIYRPGDEIRLALIVKSADWAKTIAGVPLQAEITDPRGLVVRRDKIKLSASGFEELRHSTQETSPTGDYHVNLYIVKDGLPSNQIGSIAVKVQEFLPDRLKMSARFSADSVEGWISPEDLKARVNLQNLFGTPAENRRVTAVMTLSPAFPEFAHYRAYHFYDPQRAKEGFNENLADGRTDDKGEAEFDLNLKRFARATYRLHLVAQGFEADGGRGVTAENAVLVSNMPYLVGFKTDGNYDYVSRRSARSAELIAIDPQAKKTAANGLTLAHIERSYVSILTKQENGTYKYESRQKEIKLDEKPYAITAAGVKLALDTGTAGNFGYVLRDGEGQELARINYSVAGKANLTRSLEKNAELQITLNKKDYKPGDDIEMQIQAPYVGAGLITIEREKIYASTWFKTGTTSSMQKIRIPAGIEGNGYVTVTFIRDPGSDEIYASPLSYGVQPFSINLDRRRTEVSVKAPDLVKPGDTVKLRYRSDQPSRIVVFAVDEGILQVARYKSADPLAYFFQRRALQVKTSQILDLILPEFKRLMAAAAPGGDAEGAIGRHLNPFKRKHDKPVAYWSGIVDSGPQERELEYTVPDYFNGTLRVMAVAVSDDAIGVFEKKTLIRGDFVLSPNAPTTVTPGDEFEVSVGVANNVVGSGKDAKIGLSLKTSPHFEIMGDAKSDLAVGELREAVASFHLRAKDVLGSGTLTFQASLNGDARGSKPGKLAADISVRPATPYMTALTLGNVADGKAAVPVTRDMYAAHRQTDASISHLPLVVAHGLIAYLDGFSYSCTEQLVSKGMPALILSERPEFGYVKSTDGAKLSGLIAELRSRQNADGAYALWAANHHVVDMASVYAQHFLLEAQERGRSIPPDMMANGNNWLKQLAASEGNSLEDERARAYAIYLLTRQGVVTTNFAAALQKRLETRYEKTWRQDIAAAYLASAYMLMKQERLANSMMGAFKLGEQKAYARYYDGMARDGQYLYLLARHFPGRLADLPPNAMDSLIGPMQRGWYNTYSSAHAILALDALAKVADMETASLAIREILKDGSAKSLELSKGLFPRGPFTAETAKLEFANSSTLRAFYVMNQSGFDKSMPGAAIRHGMEILREYTDLKGKTVTSVKLGEEVLVHLKFRSIERDFIDDVALVDLLPGGFEIVPEPRAPSDQQQNTLTPDQAQSGDSRPDGETRGEEGEGQDQEAGGEQADTWHASFGVPGLSWSPEYADLREDRIVLYGSVNTTISEFIYRIKATNAGTFAIPPAFGESMYEREVQARSLGAKIVVEKP
jgi:uncharacterized protein YfaS (alpha-2-macroglobulin family)